MKAVVLCGGLGTRLREETEYRPKPMVEIGGRPILWHIMKMYAHHGFREFVLCLGYRGNMIKEYFLNYEAMNNDFSICLGRQSQICYHGTHDEQGFAVTLADTGLNTMTGGRVRRIQRYVQDEPFMLTYGDGVADIGLDELLKFHAAHGKTATVTGVRPLSRYGELLVEDGRVREFSEKPPAQEAYISGGFFIFQRRFFEYLSDDDACVLEREPLERLSREGQLMSYVHKGFWHCMDTYRDFVALNELWKKGAPWKVWD